MEVARFGNEVWFPQRVLYETITVAKAVRKDDAMESVALEKKKLFE